MADLKVHVGDAAADFGNRFVDAWHRAERGERVNERHLSFDSFETLARVLTPKRLELLRHLHRNPAASINALAKAVGRDYRRVHEDVETLAEAGLVDREEDGTGLSAPYDAIETRIAL
jgi:predicted transcriptional regulator